MLRFTRLATASIEGVFRRPWKASYHPIHFRFQRQIASAARKTLSSRVPSSLCVSKRTHFVSREMTDVCASKSQTKFERLPEFAKPTHYKVHLALSPSSFSYDGQVSINLKIEQPTDYLKLHAASLLINEVHVTLDSDGTAFGSLSQEYSEALKILTIKLPQTIKPQNITLHIKFTGELNDKMRGFYRSTYKNAANDESFLASTQFESTYARLAFPCWDEPIYKATFDISLDVDRRLTALSNMDVRETILCPDGKRKTVVFNTSPLMSTYLVAFAVGDLEYIESKTKSGTIMRVYTLPGKKEQGQFALELSTRAIDWYNEWFGITYALPKCDLIAIPDFSMGAMENWGLVTYREVYLLVDPSISSTKSKARVALIIAHELAHLWFGDLVTMKWWTDLWLKEGFASFMEYLFVGYNYPEFKIWLHFLNDELARGFDLDALRNSHPIEVEINNPNELDEIYDSITYAKSNSVNRMLCYYLGEETFQKGLQIYLKRFQYNNAITRDLWDALSEASGQDVATMMSTWTKQMGFPLVSVSQKTEGNKRILKLKQQRFLADGGTDDSNPLWQVPITIVTGNAPTKVKTSFLLKEREQEFTIEDVDPKDWVKINVGTTGFYRVEYDDNSLKAMLPAISNGTMSELDRFGIANDLFALVTAGRAPASQFLDFLLACEKEDEYAVWTAIDTGITSLANVLLHAEDPKLVDRLNKIIIQAISPVAERLGWKSKPGEDSQLSLLRGLILSRLSKAGHQPTIVKMDELFKNYVEKHDEIDPDLRLAVFGSAARNGGTEAYNSLLKIFENCGFGEIERQALVAIAQTPDMALLEKIFKYGFIEGKVRSQDVYMLLVGPVLTKEGQAYAWEFFKENVQLILDKFGGANQSLFQHTFKMSAEHSSLDRVAAEVESLFCSVLDPVSLQTLDRPIRQVVESIKLNKKLLDKNASAVADYVSSKNL